MREQEEWGGREDRGLRRGMFEKREGERDNYEDV